MVPNKRKNAPLLGLGDDLDGLEGLKAGAGERGGASLAGIWPGATALGAAVDLAELANTETVVEVHLAGNGS